MTSNLLQLFLYDCVSDPRADLKMEIKSQQFTCGSHKRSRIQTGLQFVTDMVSSLQARPPDTRTHT